MSHAEFEQLQVMLQSLTWKMKPTWLPSQEPPITNNRGCNSQPEGEHR
jgi:hypothetical protein